MDYEQIVKYLTEYDAFYCRGLKKDAVRIMQELCLQIEALSSEDSDILIRKLIADICDSETFAFLLKRGNWQLPFQLKQIIQKHLLSECKREKMPELRWFCQIFKNDPVYNEYAYDCLNAAYEKAPDDKKTQELLFERNLTELNSGLHELPTGLLISEEKAQIIFQQCDEIIQHGYAPINLIEGYSAAKQEYEAYINSTN